MRQKLITILISLALLLNMATGGTCATAALLTGKAAHCQSKRFAPVSLLAAPVGTCHIGACPTQDGQLFLLPDNSSRRFQNGTRGFAPATAAPLMAAANIAQPFPAGNTVLPPPRSYLPPPLFALYCTLIC
ncbi:MAG TPA: hypothetical protein ENF48_05655 [Desulfobacteraceae bacterium]|nr:hypothetical protein [Deltaproteobacteria bacterium]HDI59825.1 hypothetical protein [Desulfobacteraceae bacterium]